MKNEVCLAIDVEGGDHGAPVMVPAALAALALHKGLRVELFGDATVIEQQLGRQNRLETVGRG